MKFNIFYGPQSYFNSVIPTEKTINLSELVRWSDARRTNPIEDDLINTYDSLIVSTEEYGGVTSSFIEMFIVGILLYQPILKYDQIYLHNPPTRIYNQLQIYSKEFEVEIDSYNYSRVDKYSLKQLKEEFSLKIFGQEHVKKDILRSLYDLTVPNDIKPKIIMLYGPPGVGKTETAYLINQIVNEGKKLLRKQFSMYHNESFYSYIFGDRSNSFAKDLIDRESNIILLDEFDKCNRTFFSAFYQLFDEGIYSDKYYEVNLKNAIILCTSNYLSEDDIRKNLGEAIYSRFDAFIAFSHFSNETKEKLIDNIYEEELLKFTQADRDIIEKCEINGKSIPDLLKSQVNLLNNARDIRRYLKQMIAVPLIDNL
ncbi:AAA family ATPase [Lysinibacillus sp. FSL K6-0057]|uniref:AAA family ATPase n=1 Tax=Lysinibacillus sp. FSL K6-0057 TaxID=2921411 RepID=UPI003159B83E